MNGKLSCQWLWHSEKLLELSLVNKTQSTLSLAEGSWYKIIWPPIGSSQTKLPNFAFPLVRIYQPVSCFQWLDYLSKEEAAAVTITLKTWRVSKVKHIFFSLNLDKSKFLMKCSSFSPGCPRLHRLHRVAVPVSRLCPASVQVSDEQLCLTYDSCSSQIIHKCLQYKPFPWRHLLMFQ